MQKVCPQCGKDFETDNLQKLRCSTHCNSRAYRDRVRKPLAEQECQHCGKTFHQTAFSQKFCSRPCGLNYRAANIYGSKFTNKYRGSGPENFIRNLLGHKRRREALSNDYMMEMWRQQDGKCAITGRQMTHLVGNGRIPTNISIDRIDSTLGYVPGNVQLVCMDINIMKSSLSMDDLYALAESILAYRKGLSAGNGARNLRVESVAKNRGRK